MSESRHEKRSRRCKTYSRKAMLLLSIGLLLSVAVSGTLAYIATMTNEVENQFTPAYVTCEVNVSDDTIDVSNTSNIDAYIRAAIVVNWMDANGDVSGTAPTSNQYSLDINNTDWTNLNGFYYHKNRVSANGGKTSNLVTSITVNGPVPTGYELSVEVVAEAIQADGEDASGKSALELSWGEAAAQWVGLK